VQELARLHSGTVDAESTVGQGTRFRVTIPSGREHLPPERIQAARQQLSTGMRANAFVEEAMRWLAGAADEPDIQRELLEPDLTAVPGSERSRVLLADDNADMRHYVQRLLAPRYAVEAVADGRAALEAVRRHPPDLVLTDVMMPRLDGFGLLRMLRADPDLRDIPVVLLSARAGEEARVEGLEAGADDYLTKPFSARELVARVDTNLGLAKTRREAARQERVLRAEAEVMRRRFEAVVENLPFSIIMVDATGRMLLGNPAMDRILGQPPQSIESSADFIRFRAQHPDGRLYDAHEYPVARALAGEVVQNHEMTYLVGDGVQRWLRVSAIPVCDASGTVVSAISVAVDVDSEKRAELALRQLNETLESRVAAETAERMQAEEALRQAQKMEAIGQLTGGVAHDFNNLLQIVMGNLESLQRRVSGGAAASADLLRLAQNALNGAQRAAVLTHRLLAFSRRQPLQPSAVDANALISGMSELLRRTLGETIVLESVQGGGLWPVYADPHQLENALLNLAVNARDAMPSGGKLTIEAANVFFDDAYGAQEQVAAGQYVMLAVSDTGTGMSKDVIARAFDPFFTTKEVGHGTGLGLSQVYGFAKQSGGHAKIYSEPGQGTTVKLYLPRRHGAEPERSQPRPAPVVAGHEETILVVEDEVDVRAHTVATLRELGYRVLEAGNGVEALAQLEGHPETRLLFTDVGLPGGMNGRQLADEARRRQPGLLVLFTTGYARNAIVHQGRLDPDVALLPKPFTYGGLAAKLREMLEMPAVETGGA
ncbi:MAG TPA: response regulator, partial [Acetobacteraceae bacterium]